MTTTKLIAQKTITASHFSSASEQASPYPGQPTPGSSNAGQFRLLSSSASGASNFVFSGTTTASGSSTTAIDTSELKWFGNDFWIDATLTITSGTYSGESQTVSDYVQSTGTLTVGSAFGGTIASGVTYTLTIPFATRQFNLELVNGGEAKTATYKFNHDGTTWLGRSSIVGTWFGGIEVADDIGQGRCLIAKASNGTLVAVYTDNSGTPENVFKTSTDGGFTWSAKADLGTVNTEVPVNAICVSDSGRILVTAATNIVYSDDNGSTWTTIQDPVQVSATPQTPTGIAQHSNGDIYVVYARGNNIYHQSSTDDGLTFEAETAISTLGADQNAPTIVNPRNTTYALFCAWETDTDAGGNLEIKGSGLVGDTWAAEVDVIDYSASDITSPSLVLDVNGDLFCSASESSNIILSRSTDKGATWTSGAATDILDDANTLTSGTLAAVDGHSIWCSIYDATNSTAKLYRAGFFETFSANAVPVADNVIKQELTCFIDVQWLGGKGIAGDTFQILPTFYYAAGNVLDGPLAKEWRSTTEGAQYIVFDLGTNVGHYANAISLFGINWQDGDIQANATDSWGSPSLTQAISSNITTAGVADANDNQNSVKDAALLASYKDYQLAGYYIRFTSGTESGNTFKILYNVGDEIFLDITAAITVATGNTFSIFADHITVTFSNSLFRFWRIAVDAQDTAEGYLKIGKAVLGATLTLTRTYSNSYGKGHSLNITPLKSPSGSVAVLRNSGPRRAWSLSWSASLNTAQEVEHFNRYFDSGQYIAFVPDASDLTACYLTRCMNGLQFQHWHGSRYNFGLSLNEEI